MGIVGIAILVSFFFLQKKIWIRLWIGFVVLQGFIWLLKFLFDRPRPFGNHDLLSSSFPSGVAADAGFAAMLLSLRWPRYWLFWNLIGICIASLRLYVGAHYASDVIFGYLIGSCIALIALKSSMTHSDRPVLW